MLKLSLLACLLLAACGSDDTAGGPAAPADTGAADTVDVAVAADEGVDDAEPDVAEDAGVEDTTPDIVEDVAEDVGPPDVPPPLPLPPTIPTGLMIRVNWVDIKEPPLCIQINPGDPCTDANALVNAYVGTHLAGGTTPLDIIGHFKPFGFEAGMDWDMYFGRGDCLRDEKGVIHWCDFDGNPTFFEDVTLEAPGTCTVFDPAGACYTTLEGEILNIDLAGVPLSFEDAFTGGQFAFNDELAPTGISTAYVQGFMKQAVAETTYIFIPGKGDTALSELLNPADMQEKDGEMGWFWKVDYSAVQVTQKPEP